MHVRFTGEIEFCMSGTRVNELEAKIREWFPDKNILLSGNTFTVDDTFENPEKLELLLLYIENSGEVINANIQSCNQNIQVLHGRLYTSDVLGTHLLVDSVSEKLEEEIVADQELMLAMFELSVSLYTCNSKENVCL